MVSIEKSEELSSHLTKHKVKHQVLNARHHEQEAYIVADAGSPGAVTIATNMAGRGTDIQLGGNIEMRLGRELERSEEHTSELQSLMRISYAVFCLKKKKKQTQHTQHMEYPALEQ